MEKLDIEEAVSSKNCLLARSLCLKGQVVLTSFNLTQANCAVLFAPAPDMGGIIASSKAPYSLTTFYSVIGDFDIANCSICLDDSLI